MSEDNNEIKDLVMTRLETLPSDAVVSLGSNGEFTRDQIIESVRRGDENGKNNSARYMYRRNVLNHRIFMRGLA